MKQQPTKYNLWLFVFLSMLPIVAIYPIRKLKKFRVVTVINFGVIGVSYLTSFIILKLGFTPNEASVALFTATPVSILIQCILVYNWTKKHNLELLV